MFPTYSKKNKNQFKNQFKNKFKNKNKTNLSENRKLRKQIEQQTEFLFGFEEYKDYNPRLAWLFNFQPTTIEENETGILKSAVDLYFIEQNGSTFKSTLQFEPYFLVLFENDRMIEVESSLRRIYETKISKMVVLEKEDLDLKNHLSGIRRKCIKISFRVVEDLVFVRNELQKKIEKTSSTKIRIEGLDFITEIREYDIPYYIRVAIDTGIRVGYWYNVRYFEGNSILTHVSEFEDRPELQILAFDIETTKSPLKFPDPQVDQVMMISYMLSGKGYLIVNREIVSTDIKNLEYTPKPEFEGKFHIFNEKNEKDLLKRFFFHIRQVKPNVIVTFNGDFFDWPFVQSRAHFHGIDMFQEIGYYKDLKEEFKCKFCPHLDIFRWVKRDSYLPMGSQGLKAVTKAKLGYEPLEIDPEDMTKFAHEQPQTLANYSVSDAVATYYLYLKYVHPFIFSLCSIIPMNPDDVLRKGSGTLCETLLMVKGFEAEIVFPNKKKKQLMNFVDGKLLKSETYIGGHVEAISSGIYRNDLEYSFNLDPSAFQYLIDNLDHTLKFSIEKEVRIPFESVENYQKVREDVIQKLENLRDNPKRTEKPIIYHLDVAAMYPNIILTNRLQPSSITNEKRCAGCIYNDPRNECKRKMDWIWRGDVYLPNKGEYKQIVSQLEEEKFPSNVPGEKKIVYFEDLNETEKARIIRQRLTDYSKKVYSKSHKIVTKQKSEIVCQRENPFYVDTVKLFRDRRYIYKEKLKQALSKYRNAVEHGTAIEIEECAKSIVLYDSLQLAHKCILNSFYGYVMRTGARWHSMEMAGIVTLTGANIITQARQLVERIGIPLELDSLDWRENIILKSPNNMIHILQIGQFVDQFFDKFGVSVLDQNRKVQYCLDIGGWSALSVDRNGKIEWQKIKCVIRQKTSRKVTKIKTSFGSVRVTDSHSIFHNNPKNHSISNLIVKEMKQHHLLTHIQKIPAIEKKLLKINLFPYLTKLYKSQNNLLVLIPKIEPKFQKLRSKLKCFFLKIVRAVKNDSFYDCLLLRDFSLNFNGYNTDQINFSEDQFEGLRIGKDEDITIPMCIDVDGNVAKIIAWIIAFGNARKLEPKKNCGVIENLFKERTVEEISELEEAFSNILQDKNQTKFFASIFFNILSEKNTQQFRIPSEIISSTAKIKNIFIQNYRKFCLKCGCLENYDKNYQNFQITKIPNIGLCCDLFVIGMQQGFQVSIEKQNIQEDRKSYCVEFIEGKNKKTEQNKIGETFGSKYQAKKEVKKHGEYVYDLSVEKNNNFVCGFGGLLCHNTDGIWCALPNSFPEVLWFTEQNEQKPPKKHRGLYPGMMLNYDVWRNFSNRQYQTLKKSENKYSKTEECSIFFEVDGPYRAMVLPASKKENESLKKRYAVFNQDGSLAELKGFEVKRRGEIKLIKIFQSQIFRSFLRGKTLIECYRTVGEVALSWLDLLYSHGEGLEDSELLGYISETRNLSRSLEDYDVSKSTAITTAKRLAEFVGQEILQSSTNRGGISCSFIISRFPKDGSVAERAIPILIFQSEISIRNNFLARWCKNPHMTHFDLRSIVDWDYYFQRLASVIQKIITIPAALQGITNPVPQVEHPEWIKRRIAQAKSTQRSMLSYIRAPSKDTVPDIEDSVQSPQAWDHNSTITQSSTHRSQATLSFGKKNPLSLLGSIRSFSSAERFVEDLLQKMPEKIPNRKKKYSEFLLFSQPKKSIRKHKRSYYVLSGTLKGQCLKGLSGQLHLRDSRQALLFSDWIVLGLLKSNVPGKVDVWISIQNSISFVQIKCPRVFYLNLIGNLQPNQFPEQMKMEPSPQMVLPRNQQRHNVYKCSISEEDYIHHFRAISRCLLRPEVVGVFELEVTAETRCILALGNCCRVKRAARQSRVHSARTNMTNFDLEELESVDVSPVARLSSNTGYANTISQLQMFCVYENTERSVGVIGVSFDSDFHIILITASKPTISQQNLSVLMEKTHTNLNNINPVFHLHHAKKRESGLGLADKILSKRFRALKSSVLGIISSQNLQQSTIYESLPFVSKNPCIFSPFSARDACVFKRTTWQPEAVQTALGKLVQMRTLREERAFLAQYAQVPLLNLQSNSSSDHMILLMDILFARALQKSSHLLWFSGTGKPSLGGIENDDHLALFMDEKYHVPDKMVGEGMYSTNSVELSILYFPVVSIISAGPESNSVVFTSANSKTQNLPDTPQIVNRGVFDQQKQAHVSTLSILRNLLISWLEDSNSPFSKYSDLLLNNFYRWLKSTQSSLHDPSLLRFVSDLIHKNFHMLVQEFEALDAKILFANFYKVLINCPRTSPEETRSYIDSLIKTVHLKDEFRYLDFLPVQTWSHLLFLDEFNFSGFQEQPNSSQNSPSYISIENTNSPTSSWQIADHLPPILKDSFLSIIQLFPCGNTNKSKHKKRTETNPVNNFSENLIKTQITEQAFHAISQFKTSAHLAQENEKTGSILSFIVYLCHTLSMLRDAEDAAGLLKRNLLQTISFSDFSPETKFRNPATPLLVHDLFCLSCSMCRDLDLSREPQDSDGFWSCPSCGNQYNNFQIESNLLNQVQNQFLAFQIQDLKCAKCKKPKSRLLSNLCEDNSHFVLSFDRQFFVDKFLQVLQVAKKFKFDLLIDVIEWILLKGNFKI
ncbi:intein-containing DNA polymerase epsilon catalytic subunit a precursor [Anaeramoeba ignava]|uniref:DNA-directed DNA polymerase n=1 Tax=Anaeramoeba ignava TaxID=1746090 RepID=A0A9Q0LL31_ANAIG|nr:intein-containing DNA polymerase epsilon catalytic subunit a precursor [Anaeramoeba ignava]